MLGRRDDGYHELATIMQTIDIADVLCLHASHDDRVQIICTNSALNTGNNLVVQAAEKVRQRLGLKQGMVIELQKRIPVSAGLGGGSSNAASVLLALRQWWNLPLSNSDLSLLAASLGADVPFFLTGGLALCEGKGERVTPLAPSWTSSYPWLLLLKPIIGISTAAVYRNLPSDDYTDGGHTRALCQAVKKREPFLLEHIQNSLERGVLQCYPAVARAREDLFEAGALFVRLSGSGPTLFAPFMHLAEANAAYQRLTARGYEVYLTCAHPASTSLDNL